MSTLENRAKDPLVQMIEGKSVVLDVELQAVVAAWAVKTSMVFEHTLGASPPGIYWSAQERMAFRVPPHVPPGETTVTIAAYSGIRYAYFSGGAHDVRRISNTGPVVPGTTATLMVGKLVLQVRSNRWKAVTGNEFFLWPTPGSDRAEWIWPQQHPQVAWPPAAPLDDSILEVFAGHRPDTSDSPA